MPPRDRMTKPCPSIPQMGDLESSAITDAGDQAAARAACGNRQADDISAAPRRPRSPHRRAHADELLGAEVILASEAVRELCADLERMLAGGGA